MSHPPNLPNLDVPAAELDILEILWAGGAQTVRTITDTRHPAGTAADYGTVQKLLQRLEAKRCVARVADRSPIEFRANVDRDLLIGRRLQRVVDDLCEGSWSPVLDHLIRRRRLGAREREELRDFVARLDRDGTGTLRTSKRGKR